jgi:hypothetical protein
MKKLFVILSISLAFFSCGENNENKAGENSMYADSVAASIPKDAGVDPHYFDYSKTTLTNDFTDTAFANFSSGESQDRFTFFVPKGNVNETKSVLRITTQEGKLIYEHIFPTSDLIYGYALRDIKTEKEMINSILVDAGDVLQTGIIDPIDGARGSTFMSNLSVDNPIDFEREDVYEQVKKSGRMLFHYRLNNESHFVLGYSKKEKAVVKILTCC